MATYDSKNINKGETFTFTLSFDGPKGPYDGKGGPTFLYGIKSDGKMMNLWLPDFVSACVEALGVKKGAELTITKVDGQAWNVKHNGKEYPALSSGEAKDVFDTKQTDDFNGLMEISAAMKMCWAEAGLIMGAVDKTDVAPETALSETGLTARCMFIEYHKHKRES